MPSSPPEDSAVDVVDVMPQRHPGEMADLPRSPNLRQFLELPISVQTQWRSYVQITEALTNLAQAGWYQQAALLCDATFTDDRIVAVVNTRVNGLFSLPMQFKYQGEGEESENEEGEATESAEVTALKQKVVKIVEDRWQEMCPGAALREMHRWGIYLNAGIAEAVWRWDRDLLIPTLKTWNPQFIYWRWDTRSIWVIHAGGQVELNPGDSRWVYFAPFGHNHGQLYGLIRALGYLWLDRVFTFQNWARATEKFSLGIIKGFMPADGNQQDKLRFEQGLTNMPHEATVILPVTEKGNKFDIEMMKTDEAVANSSYKERVQQLDASIAIMVLGQNLTTEAGGAGASGSRATAKIHDQIRMDIVRADAEVLETTLKTQLLTPFVYYNFAAEAEALGIPWQELVPNVTWNVEPPEDKQALSQGLSQVASAFASFSQAMAPVDMTALLEKFDIPTAKIRRPSTPPPGVGPQRPRQPQLEPTDTPSPDFRDQEDRPSGKNADADTEGDGQFGNPVGPGQDASGNPRRTRLSRRDKGGDVVASVAAYNEKGQLLIQRRRDSGKWCCPGGTALPGEAPEAAAARELKEETGLDGYDFQGFAQNPVPERGLVVHCFRCQVQGVPSSRQDPDQEADRFAWIDPHHPPQGIRWHHNPDVLVARVMLRKRTAYPGDHGEFDVPYPETMGGGIPPQGARPDFRDDKALITGYDDQRPLFSQYRRARGDPILLGRADAKLPPAARAGQIALDDLVDMTVPGVADLLARERDELIEVCADCTTYEEMRTRIRDHFETTKPEALRGLLAKAVGIAEALGRESAARPELVKAAIGPMMPHPAPRGHVVPTITPAGKARTPAAIALDDNAWGQYLHRRAQPSGHAVPTIIPAGKPRTPAAIQLDDEDDWQRHLHQQK